MNASSWFEIATARQKIATITTTVEFLLRDNSASKKANSLDVPLFPGRDVDLILDIKSHPPKPGLNTREGQARMLHDLGNIELQAMELAVRTLAEFPEAPMLFREELAAVALEEARHFGLCLNALEELGHPWGSWPVHRSLWDVVAKDDLLERVLIVHRYMEGAGLDAGSRLMERLSGVAAPLAKEVVGTILREEVGHVSFGSTWYRKICEAHKIDADLFFQRAYPKILAAIPRNEKPDFEIRRRAGFNDAELEVIRIALENTDFNLKRVGEKQSLREALQGTRPSQT